jgi:hypothetical protein
LGNVKNDLIPTMASYIRIFLKSATKEESRERLRK